MKRNMKATNSVKKTNKVINSETEKLNINSPLTISDDELMELAEKEFKKHKSIYKELAK